MNLRPATFSIEVLGDRSFDGYTLGETWNGWACPYFIFDQAQQLVRAYKENGVKAWYDETSDVFSFEVDAGDDFKKTDAFPAKEIEGQKFYPIGASCWIWKDEANNE